jgi:hypothetical protein
VSAFSPQGTVKRVRQAQAHFSVPMVPLGDPRLTDPFDVACDGPILDTVTFVVRGARLTPADNRDLAIGLCPGQGICSCAHPVSLIHSRSKGIEGIEERLWRLEDLWEHEESRG